MDAIQTNAITNALHSLFLFLYFLGALILDTQLTPQRVRGNTMKLKSIYAYRIKKNAVQC